LTAYRTGASITFSSQDEKYKLEENQMQDNLKERVLTSLASSANAFMNGDPSFFDYFAKDATIYSVGYAEPIQGREAYRKHFERNLTANKRDETVLDRTVQIVGDKAVVAQTVQITQAGVVANARQTIVYGDTPEGFKVLHLHTSLMGNPAPGELSANAASIRVVNEAVGVAAPVLGVAQ
jgi:ketosteroid isomerase-like protein